MSPNRLVALLVIFSLIAILVASNWSVSLPVVFLGMQMRSLPLGIWLLSGFTTGLGISLILQWLKLLETGQKAAPVSRSSRPYERTPPKNRRQPSPNYDEDDDWDVEPPPKSEEWEFDDEEEYIQDRAPSHFKGDYEAKQEPTSQNVSGSVYSYSYRQPQDTGVGKSEAVRDANYRVINPPNREPIETTADEDDWGFDFDEESSDR